MLIVYYVLRLTDVANRIAMPIITKVMIDAVLNSDIKLFSLTIVVEIFSILIFLVEQTLIDYYDGKIQADNFCNISQKIMHNAEHYARCTEVDFELMLSQNYETVKPYFYSVQIDLIFSCVSIIGILAVMLYYFFEIGLALMFIIPVGILLSKLGEDKINKLAEQSMQHNDNIKMLLLDKIKIANEEFFLKRKQISEGIVIGLTKKFFHNKKELEKKISITNNFLVYGFLNILITGVFIVSCVAMLAKRITFGTLHAMQLYTSQIWTPIENIINAIRQYKKDKPYIEDFIAALNISQQKIINEPIKSISIKKYSGLDKNGNELNVRSDFYFVGGKVYIICGNNGVGKSTLINSIMGLTQRYTGEIFINGKLLQPATSYSEIRYSSPEYYISEFGELSDCANLSSGQTRFNQMRFNLAEMASVYIIDEPTNYLDESNKYKVLDLIRTRLTPNTMVLITTNDTQVKDYFTEAVILELLHA